MSKRVSTAGMKLCYAVEASAGTMPSSGWTNLPEVKSFPSLNSTPNSIDVTPLSETEYEQSVPGLKSLGTLDYGFNYTDDAYTAIETMMSAYEGLSEGKAMWFCEYHPSLEKAVAFKGIPSGFMWDDMSVGNPVNGTLHINNESAPEFITKPTIS